MLKEAIQHIIDISKPTVKEINGQTYCDKKLNLIYHNPKATSINLYTLSSLIEYIKSNIDTMKEKMIIHIESPTRVKMYSALDSDREREYIVEVRAKVPSFPFNEYIDNESFLVGVQSKFMDSENRGLVLKFAGTVEVGTVTEYSDDGVTQKATVKTGIASKADAIVPSPISLQANRTFIEIEQPTTNYIFRMKNNKYDNSVKCGLFEADGGAWELDAMNNIKKYLLDALQDEISQGSHMIIS